MTAPDTKLLYKELRAALLRHDEAAAIHALRQIVDINPQDASAVRQLAELSSKAQQSVTSTQQGSQAITRDLYKKYRSACIAHNDTEAFEILENIIKLDASDDNARRQRAEVGKRIALSIAPQLQTAMESGDIKKISDVVQKMQSYASNDELMNVGDFAAALALYNADKNKHHQKQIAEWVAEMSMLKNVDDKQKKALFIERFACDNGVSISAGHATILKEVHDQWRELQQFREEEQLFKELCDEYARIRGMMREQADLSACRDSLMQLRTKASQLSKLETNEIETFLKRVNLALEKIQRIRAAITRKKVIKRGLSTFFSLIVLGGIGLFGYAHSTADERCAEFATAVREKDVKSAKQLLERIHFMEHIYKLVSSDYDIQLEKTREWVKTYNQHINKLEQYKEWMAQKRRSDTLKLIDYLKNHVAPACQLLSQLKEDYKYTPSADFLRQHNDVIDEIVETFRQRTMQPSQSADMPTLAKLYGEYQAYKKIFGFTPEDDVEIRNIYLQLCENLLFRNLNSQESLHHSMALYQQYKQSLPMPIDAESRLRSFGKILDTNASLPSLLAASTSLSDYNARLKQVQSVLKDPAIEAALQQLETVLSDLPILKKRLYLEKVGISTLSEDSMKSRLIQVRKSYTKDGEFFPPYAEPDLERISNLLTDDSGPAWTNNYVQAVEKQRVLIGKTSRINDTVYLRQYLPDNKLSKEKIVLTNPASIKQLNLASLRSNLSIDRHTLLRGKILPTRLMHIIAANVQADASALASAYLYSLALELLQSVHEIENGICFSKSLQKDIAEWEKLLSWLHGHGINLSNKCWMQTHPYAAQTKVYRFLQDVNSHDYEAEIRECLSKLETADCVLVGYFAPSGQMVNIAPTNNRQLYYVSNGTLHPYEGKNGTPFMPILSVDVD